jgi:hypothetical protein
LILNNTNLSGPQYAAVKHKALLLGVENGPVLLVGLGCLENGLVDVGVKFLAVLGGVEALEAVLLEGGNEDALSHLQAVVKRDQVLVRIDELVFGHRGESAVKVVDGIDEVACEALQGEIFCGLDLALCALLEIAEIGDGAEILVLCGN